MSTLPYLAPVLQAVLREVPKRMQRMTGFVQRVSKFDGPAFVQTLVFGWLANSAATLENLAQTALSLGVPISAQGLAQRFTESGARLLQSTLEAAVIQVFQSEPAALPLLQRFTGVYLLDSTQIALPSELAAQWPGCGGGHSATDGRAALKLQVGWDFRSGALQGPFLQAGRTSDRTSPTQRLALPAGSLRLSDLGYFDLRVWRDLTAHRTYWLTRWMAGTQIFEPSGTAVNLVRWLARQGGPIVDCAVHVGAEVHLAARLVAFRAPPAVVRRRRQSLKKEARRKGQPVSAERLALAAWTLVLTNVPPDQLSPAEIGVLLRLRWQIELLFKLWKSQGRLDESRSGAPWRRLCEVYAKLLGLLIQHWIMLTQGWGDPARSLVKMGQTIRTRALQLASAFAEGPAAIAKVIELIGHCLTMGCRVNKRKKKPSAFQLWLDPQLSDVY